MNTRLTHALRLACLAACLSSPLPGQTTVTTDAQDNTLWQDADESFRIEWAADGTLNRVSATVYQPVNFPDRRGIATAQTIAEEKAKARIVRYLAELSSSERKIKEVNSEIESAKRQHTVGQEEQISRETVRKMESELQELTNSYASGTLRGVIRLDSGYDDKREEAWVRVGMSRRTIEAARALQQSLHNAQADRPEPAGAPTRPGGSVAEPRGFRQPAEVRFSGQKEW
ncbi:hypothetical protein [Curvibacter gracilis]|uniref:hypothetical protein n=1 Tax=Curvibacter gracilis TaxID=230310 RepID=UPI000481F5DB|nr:hypothetical protein [Curvibacter gracilis]